VSRSTNQRLERGEMRERPSTLGWIAGAIDPDRRAEIRDQLVAAAGDEIAPHIDRWSRRQVRRMNGRGRADRILLSPARMSRANVT
jgi:hypothetical protein